MDGTRATAFPPLLSRAFAREKKSGVLLEAYQRRAPAAGRGRRIVEAFHVVARGEQAPHLRALHALAAAVHEPRLAQAEAAALVEIVGHHRDDVFRRERVQVELARDRQDEGIVGRRVRAVLVAVGQCEIRTWNEPELSAKESSFTPR